MGRDPRPFPHQTPLLSSADRERVLILAPGHPALTGHGRDRALHALFRALQRRPGQEVWFIAGNGMRDGGFLPPPLGVQLFQPFDRAEYLIDCSQYDGWLHSNRNTHLPAELEALLRALQPDLVYFGHFAGLGAETLLYVRRALPKARILLDLPDLEAVQPRATPPAASSAGPARNDALLRRLFLQRFLQLADGFVTPDPVLRQTHVDWGLPAGRFGLLPYAMPADAEVSPLPPAAPRLRLGFFVDHAPADLPLVLDIAQLIAADPRGMGRLRLEIHCGAVLPPPESQARLDAWRDRLDPAIAVYRAAAPGDGSPRADLMRRQHAVLLPRFDWQTTPTALLEAHASGRPVITGTLPFALAASTLPLQPFDCNPDSPHELADLLLGLAADPAPLQRLQAAIVTPPSPDDIAGLLLSPGMIPSAARG